MRPLFSHLPSPHFSEKNQYFHGTDEVLLQVTNQNGEAFAGLVLDDDGVHHQLTGIVSSDGTVTVQFFNPTEQRFLATGTVTFANGTYQLEAHGQIFDDFGLRPYGPIALECKPDLPRCPPPDPPNWWSHLAWNVKGMMATAHYRLVKEF